MSNIFEIGGRLVGEGQPAFIIAEAGINHNGDLRKAKEMVSVAKEIGVDCIKFQTYSADILCADRSKQFIYKSQGKEITESEYELLKRHELDRDAWKSLIEYCESLDMPFITTVQEPEMLDMLMGIGGLKAIKVGSDDFDHLKSLKVYAESGLPLIISKGMANIAEVDHVIRSLEKCTDKLAVLHCVSLYPADASYLNINQVKTLKQLYPNIVWGFSDHSQGTLASVLAVGIGAKVIEKHFTLDHEMEGPDHWFSMDVKEMKQLVEDIRFAEQAMGTGEINLAEGETRSKKIMRRRVVAAEAIKAGEVLTDSNITFKRADSGVFIDSWDIIKGQCLRSDIKTNEGINLSDVIFS